MRMLVSIRLRCGLQRVKPLKVSRNYASTATDSNFRIPVINFSKFRASKSQNEKKATADGCSIHGWLQ